MISYSNIHRFDNMPFNEYLKLNGYSHSFLKRERNGIAEDLAITDNIRVGSLVDAIITDPAKADMSSPLYPVARNISAAIKGKFGSIIAKFQKQVSYTANVSYMDFIMPTTGRLDFLLPGFAVVDLKVTKAKCLRTLIEFMGYKNQMFNYCKMAKVDTAYLMMYSIPLRKTEIIRIDCISDNNIFWQEKILKYGTVKN